MAYNHYIVTLPNGRVRHVDADGPCRAAAYVQAPRLPDVIVSVYSVDRKKSWLVRGESYPGAANPWSGGFVVYR